MSPHPAQPLWSPQLLQPSAGSSPRSSESLLDRLSGWDEMQLVPEGPPQCECLPRTNSSPQRAVGCWLQAVSLQAAGSTGVNRRWGSCSCFTPSALISTTRTPREPQGCSPPLGALGTSLGRSAVNWQVHGGSTRSLRAMRAGNGPGLPGVARRLVPSDQAAGQGWEVSSALVQLLFLSPAKVPKGSLCAPPLPRGQESSTAPVSVEWVRSPPGCQRPQMRGDKLLQVLAEVSPRWRPRRVPRSEGFCVSFSWPLLPAQPSPRAPPSGWALTSSPRYPKRQCRHGGQRSILSPRPRPPPRVTSQDCSAPLGQGLAPGTGNGRASRASRMSFSDRACLGHGMAAGKGYPVPPDFLLLPFPRFVRGCAPAVPTSGSAGGPRGTGQEPHFHPSRTPLAALLRPARVGVSSGENRGTRADAGWGSLLA